MPQFAVPPHRSLARARLGIDPEVPVVLVAGGGLGIGVEPITRALLSSNPRLLVLTVTGRDVRTALRLGEQSHERLRVWGWTEDVALLMRAADIVVGKPGGLTVAESLACGRPLLAAGTLHGQEDFNLQFLRRHGIGDLVATHDLVRLVESAVQSPALLRQMQARAWEMGRRDGAAKIAALALDLAATRVRDRSTVTP